MNLVTTFNYDHENDFANNLQKCWLVQASKYAGDFKIHIIHGKKGINKNVLKVASNLGLDIKLYLGEEVPRKWSWKKLYRSIHIWNMYNVHRVLRLTQEPIIYFDADAFPFHPLNEFWLKVTEKPFVGTPHYLRGKYLNGGVYSISDLDFIDFDKIVDSYINNRDDGSYEEIRRKCAESSFCLQHSAYTGAGGTRGGGEQALYLNYFISNNYDPYLGDEINSWNCHGRAVSFRKEKGEDKPFLKKSKEEGLKKRWIAHDNGPWGFDGVIRGVHFWKGCRGRLQRLELYHEISKK